MYTEAEIIEERALSPLACGVDIVDIQHFTRILKVGGNRFLRHIYTQAELEYCAERPQRLAGRFAAKEAIAKTLGTGIRGFSWLEIEVLSDHYGCPFVSLYRRARVRAEILGLIHWSISLSHSPTSVIAFVVASTD